jgi:hypothetical protein
METPLVAETVSLAQAPGHSCASCTSSARCQDRLLLVAVDVPIAFRFVFGSDRDTETMERRGRERRRILEASSVNRGSEDAERPVHGGHFVTAATLGFKPTDFRRLLENRYR